MQTRLHSLTFLIFVNLLWLPLVAADVQRKPNILLVVTDDQGYGDASCYGETDVQTPVMDAVAADGIRFLNFRVNPLCAPTRASLLSGQYSLEAGMWRGPSQRENMGAARRIKTDVKLLSQFLKDAGYATGIFGKWHLGYTSPNLPNDRGFDQFYGFLGGAHPYLPTKAARFLYNGQPYSTQQHATDFFTDKAVQFIKQNHHQPFFCYVAYNAVHGPLANDERSATSGKTEWLDKYEKLGIAQPRRDYCAVLEHADHSVGILMKTIEDLGLEEMTLVIYLSDNGALIDKYPGNNGPLRGAKGTTYEGGIRVPCVMQWPGVVPSGSVSAANAAHFDVFSTILDAAGCDIPQTNGRHPVHGVSLLTHLRSGGKQSLPDRELFWDLYGKMAAVQSDWKIVGEIGNHHGRFAEAVPLIESTKFELYNLRDDLGEQSDIADQHSMIYEELKLKYVAWFKRATQ